jgi:predicted transcriptional regulator
MIFYMQTIHDYILDQLEASKGKWLEVAKGSGVPYSTLKKIAYRTIASPRVKHLEKLASYFREDAAA